MTSTVFTVLCGGPGLVLPEGSALHVESIDNTDNRLTPCECYQKEFQQSAPDIYLMFHDDVTVHDVYWRKRVMEIFESHPDAVCVGFGGASSLGRPNLYKQPYRIENMARGGFVSNLTDWEVHGGHETGNKRVAVVDAFFMGVCSRFLEEVGGWPVKHITHHGLDLWLAYEAARRGKEVWMAGCSATHHGGGTSTKDIYREAHWLQGGSLESDHQAPHRWLYETYRDVLPIAL